VPALANNVVVDRVKQLKEEPYSQKEAEAAAGRAIDNGRPQEHTAGVEEMEMG
jgi:hypothetical protein